jgi:uncharacterized Zn finger protein (UPF0148 family)
LVCNQAHEPDSDSEKNQIAATEQRGKETRFCPYCGMSSFELTGEEEELVYCEYCGIDVKVKELIL